MQWTIHFFCIAWRTEQSDHLILVLFFFIARAVATCKYILKSNAPKKQISQGM